MTLYTSLARRAQRARSLAVGDFVVAPRLAEAAQPVRRGARRAGVAGHVARGGLGGARAAGLAIPALYIMVDHLMVRYI